MGSSRCGSGVNQKKINDNEKAIRSWLRSPAWEISNVFWAEKSLFGMMRSLFSAAHYMTDLDLGFSDEMLNPEHSIQKCFPSKQQQKHFMYDEMCGQV
jgi:hypothetical protein